MNWIGYKNYDHYFTVSQLTEWSKEIVNSNPTRISAGKKYYWNIPVCFDIETSSYYEMGVKRCTMYCWSLNINGSTIFGRTWNDFIKILEHVSQLMRTDSTALIIYVHNLPYEFQWMRGWFEWKEVFATKERRSIHAVLPNGIEFKCSYILSNYRLAYIGEKLIKKYTVQKDVGALDYSLVRHSLTPMTDKEIWYSVHDTQVVTSFIQEKIENEGGIINIPLTNTGYVRRYCRNACFTNYSNNEKYIKKVRAKYHELMNSLKIVSRCEYDQLKWAFTGGFTHTAPKWSGKVLENVTSFDLASSYPAVMVMKKFPMSRGVFVGKGDVSDIDYLTNTNHAVLFTARFKNIRPKFIWENYISVSRCQELSKDYVSNNGRVATASTLQVTITDVDWDIINKVYEWDEIEIFNIRYYVYGYLPKFLIMAILNLFGNKTSLKGIDERYTEYMVSKNMINAAYGMTVTSIIRDIYEYTDGDWNSEEADKEEELKDYNKNYNRFLFYPWGVWVTAHARHNLWDAILEFGPDYVYADTDSIKAINAEKHDYFFSLYNLNIYKQLIDMCNFYDISPSLTEPKTVKGVKKRIGVWENEGDYQLFKAIGAKRYMYEKDNELWFTISGVNKHVGVPYLLKTYSGADDISNLIDLAYSEAPDKYEESQRALSQLKILRENGVISYENVFEEFNDGLYFPSGATGKSTLTYIDKPFISNCTDYLGKTHIVMEMSGIHMEPQDYRLSQTAEYLRFLQGFKDASI